MRSLYLIRHTTPQDGEPGQSDFERSLSSLGIAEAEKVGRFLEQLGQGTPPQRVLCSPARRTRETYRTIEPFLPAEATVEHPDELYCGSRAELASAIAEVEPEIWGLAVIAHNPGIAALAHGLVGRGAAAEVERLARTYPPGAIAVIELEAASWAALRDRASHLLAFRTPAELH